MHIAITNHMKVIMPCFLFFFYAISSQAASCESNAIQLLKKDYPFGFEIISWNRDTSNRHLNLLNCNSVDSLYSSIETLIHETIHDIDQSLTTNLNSYGYLLVNGETKFLNNFPLDSESTSMILPYLSDFEKSGNYAKTYLVNSNQKFDALLDELNAYTHGLQTRILLPKSKWRSSEAAGLLALIDFTLKYYLVSKELNSQFYQNELQSSEYKKTIKEMILLSLQIYKTAKTRNDLLLNAQNWEKTLEQPEIKTLIDEINSW